MKIDRWIAEATECDFKVALETRKPKSWLKRSAPLPMEAVEHCSSALIMTEI